MAIVNAPPKKMTYEEFLDAVDEDTHAEWVDGEMVMSSPVAWEHNDTGSFLIAAFRHYVEAHHLGVALYEFQMKTGPKLPGREPDVIFLAEANRGRLRHTYLDGPGDLVVEIVSPESVTRDREEKYREYEQGGVREYWVLDVMHHQPDFYVRGDDGLFAPAFPDADGIYRSAVMPGLWLRVDWLWNPPNLLALLKEWKLI